MLRREETKEFCQQKHTSQGESEQTEENQEGNGKNQIEQFPGKNLKMPCNLDFT